MTSQRKNLADTTLGRWSKRASPVTHHADITHPLIWYNEKVLFTSVLLFRQIQNPSVNMRKHQRNSTEEHSAEYWLIFFKKCQLLKNKKDGTTEGIWGDMRSNYNLASWIRSWTDTGCEWRSWRNRTQVCTAAHCSINSQHWFLSADKCAWLGKILTLEQNSGTLHYLCNPSINP